MKNIFKLSGKCCFRSGNISLFIVGFVLILMPGNLLPLSTCADTHGEGENKNKPLISAEQKGLDIAIEADQRDAGFGDSMVELTMILKNRHGEESIRKIRNRVLEKQDDGDRLLIIFDRPRDVKGTVFLSFTHIAGPDDQWLYLPALKRVKRISSNSKSGPFMGSEFAYEDFVSQEVKKYSYLYLRDEVLDGRDTFVVERYPGDPKSGYTRQMVWYDKQGYLIQKIDYYDRKDELLKTLTYKNYKQYIGKYWRADEMYMVNHQTGKSTRLVFKNYKFRNSFTDRDFDRNSLKRVR